MPEPTGRVYWSSKAQRFYKEGQPGFISKAEAFNSLEYNAEANRFIDQRKQFVPNSAIEPDELNMVRFTRPDAQGRPFLSAEFRDALTDRTAAVQQSLRGNQQLTIRTVVTTEDGKVWVDYTSSKLGGRPNVTDLEELASRKMKANLQDEGYTITTHDVDRLTKSRTYLTRTVNRR